MNSPTRLYTRQFNNPLINSLNSPGTIWLGETPSVSPTPIAEPTPVEVASHDKTTLHDSFGSNTFPSSFLNLSVPTFSDDTWLPELTLGSSTSISQNTIFRENFRDHNFPPSLLNLSVRTNEPAPILFHQDPAVDALMQKLRELLEITFTNLPAWESKWRDIEYLTAADIKHLLRGLEKIGRHLGRRHVDLTEFLKHKRIENLDNPAEIIEQLRSINGKGVRPAQHGDYKTLIQILEAHLPPNGINTRFIALLIKYLNSSDIKPIQYEKIASKIHPYITVLLKLIDFTNAKTTVSNKIHRYDLLKFFILKGYLSGYLQSDKIDPQIKRTLSRNKKNILYRILATSEFSFFSFLFNRENGLIKQIKELNAAIDSLPNGPKKDGLRNDYDRNIYLAINNTPDLIRKILAQLKRELSPRSSHS